MERAYVDLSPVTSRLDNVGEMIVATAQKVDGVSGQVEDLREFHAQTHETLENLIRDFEDYKDQQTRAQTVLWAQGRVVELRQIVEKQFGRYEKARRMATGLVAAMSAGTVPARLIKDLTASGLVMEGRFWLPAALQALGEWMANAKPLAELALREAIQRNDAKTAMFFALVCRRCNRHEATATWLSRYFQCQHPSSLDRDVVIMLNGMAVGVFGANALGNCLSICREWFKELEQEAGFQQTQIDRWKGALDSLSPGVDAGEYATLRKYAPDSWPHWELALARARRHEVVLSYFRATFAGELIVPPRLTAMVDELLESLVRDHDAEEMPLAREIKTCEYLIQYNGNRRKAEEELQRVEPAFQAKQDFATLLSNIAMYPEKVNATEGAQRYAIALSKEWILEANSDLAARDRNGLPSQMDLAIGSWKGTAQSGADEASLADSISRHYDALAEQQAAQVKLSPLAFLAPLIALALAFNFGLTSIFSWILILAGAGFFLWQRKSVTDQQATLRQGALAEKEQALKILKACTAELTDLQREIQAEDQKAEHLRRHFDGVTPEQYVKQLEGAVRRVL